MSIGSVDPIVVEIIRNSFNSIAGQMSDSLKRAAYSPVIYDMMDFGVGIFDAKAQLLGQGPGLPLFLGGLDHAIKVVILEYANPKPGDVFLVNDSYLVGSHLNDVTAVSPIFFDHRLTGWTAVKAHWNDIGGKDAGFTVDSTEIYQEGLRLPPVHIMKDGKWVDDILDLLMRNSRTPQTLFGDLSAQIASCQIGTSRLTELISQYGLETVEAAKDEIFIQWEAKETAFIATIPQGIYSAEGFFDSDGYSDEPVLIKLAIRVEDGELIFDLTGSSDQRPGSTNCGYPQTVSAARLAFQYIMHTTALPTGGSFRHLHVIAPKGSIFNARSPSPCYMYGTGPGMLLNLAQKALSTVLPEHVIAGQPDSASNVLITGTKPDGSVYVTGEATAIGWGGNSQADGGSAFIDSMGGDLRNHPVETMEAKCPVVIHSYALREGSSGAGKYRGGFGVEKIYEIRDNHAEISIWFERAKFPGWGLFGGQDAKPPRVIIQQGDNSTRLTKVNHMSVSLGTRIIARTGGGGGYGSSIKRDPSRVLDDVLDGYISTCAAKRDYKVCLNNKPLCVDVVATRRLRKQSWIYPEREGDPAETLDI